MRPCRAAAPPCSTPLTCPRRSLLTHPAPPAGCAILWRSFRPCWCTSWASLTALHTTNSTALKPRTQVNNFQLIAHLHPLHIRRHNRQPLRQVQRSNGVRARPHLMRAHNPAIAPDNRQILFPTHRRAPTFSRHRTKPRVPHRHARQVLDQRSEEHTSELQSRGHLVCRLLLEKKKKKKKHTPAMNIRARRAKQMRHQQHAMHAR